MSNLARLCASTSVLTMIATAAAAQPLSSGLQPEYVIVTGVRDVAGDPAAPDAEITAAKAQEQINTVNTEDMLKYAPSLTVRKRHYGDVQDPVATRTSGVGASARSLIFVDGVMVSSPIGNNNTSASPHFGVAAPQDVSRIDVLYGPFAAQYAGNSIGAVINISTRMPDHFELYGDATGAVESFSKYATDETVGTWQLSAGIGDRIGAFSWRLSANHLDAQAQPLGYATATRAASPSATPTVTGAYNDRNRTGAAILVLGDTGIEHQVEDTDTLKLAYDFDNGWQLSYLASLFHMNDDAGVNSYLRGTSGNPVYVASNINGYALTSTVNTSTFSNQLYNYQQTQLAQGLTLNSSRDGDFTWQLIASDYNYLGDKQRNPTTALPAAFAGGAGQVNRQNGTGWYTLDANGVYRGFADHEVSFGLHRDAETFAQIRNNLSDWIQGGLGSVVNAAKGRTATNALWAQDIWTLLPELKLSLGLRAEDWRAYAGTNTSASPALNVTQPRISASTLSPKATLAWQVAPEWSLTGSYGRAYRMPTVTEMYQAITTGPTLTVPNPNLRPERADSYELAVERKTDGGLLRASFFEEDIAGALLSQSAPLVAGSSALYSYVQNVDRTRARGIELVGDQYDAFIPGLELMGSVTFVDGRITADRAFPAAVNKYIPQLPRFRAAATATYRRDDWSFTLAGRYSDPSFGTIDNSDPVSQTFQGFGGYMVLDARVQYRLDQNWRLSMGVDNLNDDKYFLYHPFPQRTFLMEIHYAQ